MRKLALKIWFVALLMPMLLLQGCATPLPASTPVQIPLPPPALMKPVPPESYLERAQRNIEAWQKALTPSAIK